MSDLPTGVPPAAPNPFDQFDRPHSDSDLDGLMDAAMRGFSRSAAADLDPQTVKSLRDSGLFNDYEKGQHSLIRTFNEALVREVVDPLFRRLPMGVYGAIRGIAEAPPGGLPGQAVQAVASAATGLLEAFPAGRESGFPSVSGRAPAPRAEPVPTAGERAATPEAIRALTPTGEPVPRPVAAEPFGPSAPENDIHVMARQGAPDTFAEYDTLSARKQTLTQWLDELGEGRAEDPRAKQLQERIDTILSRVSGVEDRLTKRRAAELDNLRDDLDYFLKADTPDMMQVRRDLMTADERMRDLAPDVSAAYRDAQGRMPPPAEPPAARPPEPVEPSEAISATPVAEEARPPIPEAAAPAAEASAKPPEPLPIPPGDIHTIAKDISDKLVDAGRSQQEADNAAAIVAAHYEARAQRFQGALGTPLELYRAEGPQIRRAAAGGPQGAAAGRTTIRDSRTIITLFEKADASTFIHETGHQWLEELLRDAEHEKAPEDLKADADRVRQWLGAGREPSRAQHEQFARGFEAYMMEGRAPSQALAGVFAKFRDWLLQIYTAVTAQKLPVIDSVRGVFDRLVGSPDHPIVIAPERQLPFGYDEAHTRAAEAALPEHAEFTAPAVREERDQAAKVELPETIDVDRRTDRGAGEEAGGGAPGSQVGDGQGAGPRPPAGAAGGVAPGGEIGPGGGQFAVEGAATLAEPRGATGTAILVRGKPETAYRAVPKEPLRLADFLKREGGLQNEGGEIRHIGGDQRRGLINNKTGLALDDAALRAWEAGYFPELADRPTISDLVEALSQDLRETPRYADQDKIAVAEYQDALAHNHEVDRIAQQLGIDPRDYTKEQFWNMAAEHLAGEKAEAEMKSLAEAREHEFAEAERRAKEWAASRGDAWEPERHHTRTLEDLARADRDEASAGAAPAQPAGLERPGSAAGDQRPLQGERRQGGGDAAAGHGLGAAAAEPKPAAALVDKAGNIRLDNIDTPDDFKDALREAAARNGDFLDRRRGVVSDAQRQALADVMGITPDKVLGKEIGEAFSDSEIKLLEQTLAQSTATVRELAIKAATSGLDADLLAMTEAYLRHDMIQGLYSQATAEAGRAFRALKKSQEFWSRETLEANKVLAQRQAVSDVTGRTLYQMRQLANKIANLDEPGQISKLIRDSQKPGLFDWLQSLFVNSLLSGPFTHLGYSIAGEIFGLFRGVAETGASAGVGGLRRAFGIGEAEYAHIGEVGAQLYGQYRGARAGIANAYQAIRENRQVLPAEVEAQAAQAPGVGQPVGMTGGIIPNPQIMGRRIPLGTVLESPGRMVAALHSFNWTTFYAQSLSGQAFRMALREGLDVGSPAFAQRVAYLTANATEEMIKLASDDAGAGALVTRPSYDSFMAKVSRVTNWGIKVPDLPLPGGHSLPMGTFRPIKFIDPFVQIQANVQKAAWGRNTPFALFSQSVQDDLAMKNGGVAFDRTAGKILAGTSFMIGAGALAVEGLLNHSGPSATEHPAEAALWRRTHGLPHGLNIGALSFDTLRMGNLGLQMSVAADLAHIAGLTARTGFEHEQDMATVVHAVVEAFAHNILDETFSRGPSEMMRAVELPDRYGAQWVRNFAASFLPFSVGLGQVAHQIDPYSRQARSLMDAVKAKIPIVSETLQPRFDTWGQPVPARGWLGTYYQQHLRDDPVDRYLETLGHAPSPAQRRIDGIELTEPQYADYARIGGRYARMAVENALAIPGFKNMPPEAQIKTIQAAISGSRKQAAGMIMLQSQGSDNDIIAARKATADAAAHGASHEQVKEMKKLH